MNVTKDIRYVGVVDNALDLFEGQYIVPEGMRYNSYVVLDEKIAVFDTVDGRFGEEWLKNLEAELQERAPDYLIVQHMEPDHSANIARFAARYPSAVVVASAQAFRMMKNYFGTDYPDRRTVVKEGDTLALGAHTLTFYTASMVHWPEVIVTYDSTDKVLFSADGFGKFGAEDTAEDWDCEARRYYFGIVGKFGAQVQALLQKVAGLELSAICPLHGPVLSGDLSHYINRYDTWSSYRPEEAGVCLAYTSVYGNTKKAVLLLKEKLEARGVKVALSDLARDDMAEVVEDAFRYDRLVLATTTYNTDIFPFMRTFIDHLTERNFKNRTVALIENGSWGPQAARVMRGMLEGCEGLRFAETAVRILAAPNAETEAALEALADELTR